VLPVAQAQVSVNINIGAPPPPRAEPLPPPRHGYVWIPGFWDWDGHRHFWREGHGCVSARLCLCAAGLAQGTAWLGAGRGGWRNGPPPARITAR
jgi:hypothetical protein